MGIWVANYSVASFFLLLSGFIDDIFLFVSIGIKVLDISVRSSSTSRQIIK